MTPCGELNAATGTPVGTPMRHRDRASALAFSPDGKMILSGSWAGTARLWDAATGILVKGPLNVRGGVSSVAFSPDGKTILTGGYAGTARLWTPSPAFPSPNRSNIESRFRPRRSRQTAERLQLEAGTRRRGYGTPPPACPSPHPWSIRAQFMPWRSLRMARPSSPAAARLGRCGSGTLQPAFPTGQSLEHPGGVRLGFQP